MLPVEMSHFTVLGDIPKRIKQVERAVFFEGIGKLGVLTAKASGLCGREGKREIPELHMTNDPMTQ